MQIIKTEIPKNSSLYSDHHKYNYFDSYEAIIKDKNNLLGISDIAKAFLKLGPKWIDYLLIIRNKIVSLFGLKTTNNIDKTKYSDILNFEPEERIGIFKVFSKTNNEIILGEDDKHLNFRVSLFLEESKINKTDKIITVTTVVKYNNWLGRLYFFPVKPFHKLIVQITMKKNLQELEKNS
ncbi:MAG: DUF2867 domain-containing protein [bacterium]